MLKFVRWCAAAVALLSAVPFAAAQSTYPDKPVHFIVAFVPGGATDTFARQISNDLQNALGQPVVIENRPGAGGYIAWNHVATSEPDGYTLLLAENAVAISQALYKKSKSSFDPLTQYDAVAGLAASPSALVVANNIPVKTVAELLAYAKTVPQKLNFASAGVGSVSHLNFEVFMDNTGMQAIHVPYKGGGQAIGDVIAGHVPMTITSVQAVKGLVESGKVKALAVTSPARSPAMPDVPTMKEAGVAPADVELRFWFAIFGPKGLPDAVKARLSETVAKVMSDPKVQERLAKLDITPDVISARPCTRSSRARSRTGPASSTLRGSRRNRQKCRIRGAPPAYRRHRQPVFEWARRPTGMGSNTCRASHGCARSLPCCLDMFLSRRRKATIPIARSTSSWPFRRGAQPTRSSA
jgi:tripartite-type tricarboxylate transporter receptor subunit TctC